MSKYLKAGGEALAKAVEKVYESGKTDYHLEPLNLWADGAPVGTVKPGDGVIFCCRRGEREVELTDAFTDPAFPGFSRVCLPRECRPFVPEHWDGEIWRHSTVFSVLS